MSDFITQMAGFLPFRDSAACAKARSITRAQLEAGEHPNPDFKIRVIDQRADFYRAFALDIIGRLQQARDERRKCVIIFPVGPVPQFAVAADIINKLRLDCSHLVSFNMDEYADQDGNTAPADWPGSFQYTMMAQFFGKLDPALRPPASQINFPTKDRIADYSKRLQDAGEADVCYGGIGWCGHIAFWDPHLADKYPDFEEWKSQGAQLVDLHPMTIMQNALHSFRGDWSRVAPMANTIGPRDILAARARSFWLDGAFPGSDSWQAFIGRLVAYGPVNAHVPGSLLQLAGTDYTFLGEVADDVAIHMA
ncbi:MAG: hypothetical protein IT204_23250 [Fimbriimonadaceae bacterium]|nr:hypothetical protein [Fimbriimonadaceae bacterium]